MSRILDINSDNAEIYILNDVQKSKIKIAREQIKNGEFFTEQQANIEFQK